MYKGKTALSKTKKNEHNPVKGWFRQGQNNRSGQSNTNLPKGFISYINRSTSLSNMEGRMFFLPLATNTYHLYWNNFTSCLQFSDLKLLLTVPSGSNSFLNILFHTENTESKVCAYCNFSLNPHKTAPDDVTVLQFHLVSRYTRDLMKAQEKQLAFGQQVRFSLQNHYKQFTSLSSDFLHYWKLWCSSLQKG